MPGTGYIQGLQKLLSKHARFFVAAGLAGLALRLLFVFRFPAVVDDSRLYADIAKNWLYHGIYGLSSGTDIVPTLSRLPGYPAFLAMVFAIFGAGKFLPVLILQVMFDLGTCFLVADLARRFVGERSAQAAFLLTALCPFLANYAAAALTETLEIFFTALAFDLAARGVGLGEADSGSPRADLWLACGFSISAAILLRPDGGIVLASIGAYLGYLLIRKFIGGGDWKRDFQYMVLLGLGALLPLVPWTVRNLHTFHLFQPLAPRYANDPNEPALMGFNRWVKTWMAEFVSVQEIYWNVPDDEIDVKNLPDRAFDSASQRRATEEVFAQYNEDHAVTPEIDAQFGALAKERIAAHPLRYYVWLPALRIADMWLRPRTELTSADPRWWEFNDDAGLLAVSIGFGAINLGYVVLGMAGLVRTHKLFGIGLFVVFLILRSAFLGTMENPEPRYTLECYPLLIVLASAVFKNAATGSSAMTHA